MPRQYTMTRRAEARDQTRNRILDATAELITERGSSDLTISDVADRADVAARTVYNHFASIDDLTSETMNRMAAQFIVVEPAEVMPGERAADALERILRDWYAQLERNARLLDALMSIHDSPALSSALEHARILRRERMEAVLREAEREGSLRVTLTEARSIAYALTGVASWSALVEHEGLDNAEAARLVARILTRPGGDPA
jgi:AcrR family transcriptional regulator